MTEIRPEWDRNTVYIDGQWRIVPKTIEVENPATETMIGRAACAGPAEVDQAVTAANAAGHIWGHSSPAERADLLDALVMELRARRELLVETTVAEVGAPVRVAEEGHVDLSIDIFSSYAQLARDMPASEQVDNSLVLRRPAGVVACITPWNYPLYQLAGKIGAVLAAGCTAVVKPAELTPLSTYVFFDAAIAAGVPAGVLNLVPGPGRSVGSAMAAHSGVDVVSFTGSTGVGRTIARTAAESFTRTCLELGGKSASIVLDDAQLDTAVAGTVTSAMYNSGQTCSACTRLLVPRGSYDEAVELAAAAADRLVIGDPRERGTELGPVISAAQRNSIVTTIEQARARGGRIATGDRGGLPARGHYVAPTVIADLDENDPAVREEIFGPVLVILPHDGDADAIRQANDSDYGLSGAVWSGDTDRALAVASQMDTGQVDINGAPFNPAAPFGGWKASGLGRELGRAGIEELIETTSIQR